MVGKKLDIRLLTVAQQIRSKTHADIGSDHGGLLVWLLKNAQVCLLYTSPSPRDKRQSRMPSSA